MSYSLRPDYRIVIAAMLVLVIAIQAFVYVTIQGLERDVESFRDALLRFDERVEDLSEKLEAIAEKTEKAATIEDLRLIYLELSDIRARVAHLSVRQSSLEESLARIEARVVEISERVGFPVVVRDWSGREVVIVGRPARLVSLAPSVTETLYYLGALDRLVGVDDFSNYPPVVVELREKRVLRSIGGFWNPSVEAIIALRPDLVIGVASVPSHLAIRDVLSSYGIAVLLLGDASIDQVVDSTIVLGIVLGKSREAYELAWRLRYAVYELSRILESHSDAYRGAALVVWVEPLWVAGSYTWQHDLLTLAGLRNVYGELPGWQAVSPETLLKLNPSIIIITTSHGLFTREDLLAYLRSALGDAVYEIEAVRKDMIVEFTGFYEDSLVRPSPRFVIALYSLAVIGNPHVFGLDSPPKRFDDSLDVVKLVSPHVSETTRRILEYLVDPARVALVAPVSG